MKTSPAMIHCIRIVNTNIRQDYILQQRLAGHYIEHLVRSSVCDSVHVPSLDVGRTDFLPGSRWTDFTNFLFCTIRFVPG